MVFNWEPVIAVLLTITAGINGWELRQIVQLKLDMQKVKDEVGVNDG